MATKQKKPAAHLEDAAKERDRTLAALNELQAQVGQRLDEWRSQTADYRRTIKVLEEENLLLRGRIANLEGHARLADQRLQEAVAPWREQCQEWLAWLGDTFGTNDPVTAAEMFQAARHPVSS
jgi:predicted  nucleic acid-binding Zn-ribbon protein